MVLWLTNAGDGYFHAGVARLERARMAIVLEDEDRWKFRPGPVRMFVGIRRGEDTNRNLGPARREEGS